MVENDEIKWSKISIELFFLFVLYFKTSRYHYSEFVLYFLFPKLFNYINFLLYIWILTAPYSLQFCYLFSFYYLKQVYKPSRNSFMLSFLLIFKLIKLIQDKNLVKAKACKYIIETSTA